MNKVEVEFSFKDYHVEATCTICVDKNYGANADGNFGVKRTEVYEVQINKIFLQDDDENTIAEVSDKISKELRSEIENEAESLALEQWHEDPYDAATAKADYQLDEWKDRRYEERYRK